MFVLGLLLLVAIVYGQDKPLDYTTDTNEEGISNVIITDMGDDSVIDHTEAQKGELTDDDLESPIKSMGRFFEFSVSFDVNVPDTAEYVTYYATEVSVLIQVAGGCDSDPLAATTATGTGDGNLGTISYESDDGAGGLAVVPITKWEYTTSETSKDVYVGTIALDVGDGIAIGRAGTPGTVLLSGLDFSQCEPETYMVEIIVEGELRTAEPTMSPTFPPTGSCEGEVTWGDPHMWMWEQHDRMYNFQGKNRYYYIHPCLYSRRDTWPVFISISHWACNSVATCIHTIFIEINTKPTNWIIELDYSNNFKVSQEGTGADAATAGTWEAFTAVSSDANAPTQIAYDDGNGQRGVFNIYIESGKAFAWFSKLNYADHPDAVGGLYEMATTFYFQRQTHWMWMPCPVDFRDLLCGTLGRYMGGDCSRSDAINNVKHCRSAWRSPYATCYGMDGTFNDAIYTQLGYSWDYASVNAYDTEAKAVANANGYTDIAVVAGGTCTDTKRLSKSHKMQPQKKSLTRDPNVVYPGKCNAAATDGDANLVYYNQTCYENTIVRFDKCCKEIGFCDLLHAGCLYDMCACTTNNTATDAEDVCMKDIVQNTMNTTCSVDALYPTATPTSAPTQTPTGLIAGLGSGASTGQLVGIMAAFVVVFLLIAIGGYCYYKRKTKGKAYVPDNVQMGTSTV